MSKERIEPKSLQRLVDECTPDPRLHNRLVNLAREMEDATELVRYIMSQGKRRINFSHPSQEQKPGGRRVVDTVTHDFVTGRSDSFFVSYTGEGIGPNGELHSEHLYLAGRCIGVAKKVEKGVVDTVIERLVIEFDLELLPPRRAIETFGYMGNIALEPLLKYIKDRNKELFSREDAALALGAIGTDLAVEKLGQWLVETPHEDKAMPLYALGHTRNRKAVPMIQNFLQREPNHPKAWVAQEALRRLSGN